MKPVELQATAAQARLSGSNRARLAGACLQGLFVGVLLFVAIVQLASSELGARLFRYQGF